MKGFAAALALALLAAPALEERAAAQEPQPPRTTFRSAVDLVPVDVNVVDKNGRPVTDLTAGEFTLEVDGKPRRIASAQFIAVDRASDSDPPKPREYNSNAGAQTGRLVMIAIDSGNIAAGRGKQAIEAARRFVGTLNRSDRVALVVLPGAGPQIDFTSNHAIVQTLLGNVVGQAADNIGQKRIGLAEALAIDRNDRLVINEITDRECPSNSAPEIVASCLVQLAGESRQMIAQVKRRTNNALISLRYLFERMAVSEAPKTLVLISEGLLLERQFSEVSWVESHAAAAHVTLYVMQLDMAEMEASANRTSPSRGEDRELLREGLDRLAGLAKGDVFRVGGDADFAFRRLGLELSGYYLLSFEPQPGDRDGKPHKIRIDIRRKDLTLRSRREFSVNPAGARSTDNLIADTLRAPLLATDIPLKLTTYTFQDTESSKLKIVLATDIDRSANPDGQVTLGFVMFDDKGKLVASDLERPVASPVDRGSRTQKYLGAAVAAPGVYTLKVAVVDEAGRRGSVERTFTARINGFGQLHATDLLIAEGKGLSGPRGLPPAVAADFTGDELRGYVELFSEVPEQLQNATVVMEVAKDETSAALDSTPARFQPVQAGADKRRVAEAGVPIALLPGGDYLARAVISVGGRKVGQVVRPFRITRAATSVSAPGGATVAMRAAAPIPFVSRIEAFDKSSVLTPQVVGFFLDRMSGAAVASATAVRPAIDSARAGRFDQALQSLKDVPDDQLAAVFVKGVALLATGSRADLDAAAEKFRAALRIDPGFLPAAFYLGACYAAGGKDRDAAGAWQTSLITESNAPFVYTLLGDALLRLKDVDQAIDILIEARTLWPADDQVAMRLGAALVMANKPAEAMTVLLPYLAAHPTDHERILLVLRALYEARSAGRPIATVEADRALFLRYAAAYAAAKGPQQALVAQWRQYVEK
jgi:VWFA-related protein